MDDRGFDTINVIPLVDVMLVLLTIVLTTSTFIAVGAIPLQLPKAENVETSELKTTTIEIDKDGTIFLDSKKISLNDLKISLSTRSRIVPILIRADKNIALQIFVDVMDGVKSLGFKKVSLQTENKL